MCFEQARSLAESAARVGTTFRVAAPSAEVAAFETVPGKHGWSWYKIHSSFSY